MIIDRNLKKYIAYAEDPLTIGLQKMDQSKMRVIFIVSEKGMLEGIVTDGDVRRWIISQSNHPDLQTPLINICNKEFEHCLDGSHISSIQKKNIPSYRIYSSC